MTTEENKWGPGNPKHLNPVTNGEPLDPERAVMLSALEDLDPNHIVPRPKPEPEQAKAKGKDTVSYDLLKVLRKIRSFDINMSLLSALVLLRVIEMERNGDVVNISKLADDFDCSTTTASRLAYFWGSGVPKTGVSGHGLLEISLDPNDRRKRLIHLTTSGVIFAKSLNHLL